ncbi:ParA family protein [Robertmurraya sp. FSL R5-0851]|uniref:ParA family protein n=1 Tax=Robertmurraya sp. FSL R5-0851 TaxID=2921584 RepID=UPI0030FA1E95
MEIAIISKNSMYKELFDKHEEVTTCLVWDQVKDATIELGAIILDGEIFDIHQLPTLREKYPQTPVFFKPHTINSDVIMRNLTRLCAAHKVKMLSEYNTWEQTVEEIMNQLTDRESFLSKRLIGFFGTHSGSGVSTTVLNVARSLSQRVEEKVLVLSLNSWDPADYFYDYNGQYLNDLKIDLKTGSISPARLQEAVSKQSSFYHLAGNRDIKMQRFFQPHEIQNLIKVAQEIFDVILIDAGTHFDTAPTIQSYLSSNLKFLVATQEEKGYRGYFPYVYQQLIEPIGGKSEDFMLVVNRFQPANTLINERALEEELNMTRVVTIPDMGELGTIASAQKRLLYDSSESLYTKNIDLLSNLIISECRLKEKELVLDGTREKRKGFMSIFK